MRDEPAPAVRANRPPVGGPSPTSIHAPAPPRSLWKRRGRYVVAALLLHIAISGGLYLSEAGHSQPQSPPARPLVVQLVNALAPITPPSAETDPATDPAPRSAAPSREGNPRQEESIEKTSTTPQPPELAREPGQSADAPASPLPPTDPDASVVATAAAAVPTPAASDSGAYTVQGVDARQTWESRVLAHLERNKRYPAEALRRVDRRTACP